MEEREERLSQERIMEIRYRWSAGPYLGRFLAELRDKGKFYVVRCPGCERFLLPPRIVCSTCYTRIPEYPDGWIALSGRGILLDWQRVIYPQMDPETGEVRDEPFLHGTFRLDHDLLFVHYLGPADLDEGRLQEGMKVEMVMKPQEQREGKVTDIHYFRIVED
ncbi:MAG: hypothetical protein JRF59_13360 [Deltaproteobacteria bacterium]|nr:hypothetical protein [Deltaproteobacteria bacterium]MBW1925069.1 hypothetical protein [Deltaproteobacteria bacterium]MBW2008700.1 hypothetical protein [Deltaproteobacteria bacterium]MBW2102571.1 hypothetical protein [Deltaproteobacteria bacterium]MBW2348808.1 hypothetical protein [Deltaproteobacteria bacterium]